MKTRLLIIIGIVLATIVTLSIVFSYSFDGYQYSKENPYGFSAHVFYSKELLPIMCPLQSNDCGTHLQLSIGSDTPSILQGYKICNGLSCVSQDDLYFSSKEPAIIPIFGVDGWKTGDKTSIKVTVVTQYDETYTHPFPIPFYIDLGESEITEYGVNKDATLSENIDPYTPYDITGLKQIKVGKEGKIFDVKYLIKGATVQGMIFSNYTNSLVITIDTTHEGDLEVTIPRDLLDARMDYCPPRQINAPDDRFFVLLDGEEIFDDEILTTVEARTLKIPFDVNSEKIEIIGTCFI
ncbi:MAG: hypothetical protein K8Q89_05140 [Nitrosarchaeum sp.]|nr:hypothetical protein [Nitrosarchaeum sp.]